MMLLFCSVKNSINGNSENFNIIKNKEKANKFILKRELKIKFNNILLSIVNIISRSKVIFL
ncbi:hypothetical protein JP27_06795 [Gallibacterium anatis]|nr:hypothetical protein JP27_06795 [Gallibacterium anatis]